PRFQKAWPTFMRLNRNGFFCIHFPDECFPADWLGSTVPVIFDFQSIEPSDQPEDILRNTLWCLLPGLAGRYCVVVGISRNDFVTTVSGRAELLPAKEIVNAVAKNMEAQRTVQTQMPLLRPGYNPRRRRRYARF